MSKNKVLQNSNDINRHKQRNRKNVFIQQSKYNNRQQYLVIVKCVVVGVIKPKNRPDNNQSQNNQNIQNSDVNNPLNPAGFSLVMIGVKLDSGLVSAINHKTNHRPATF